MAANALANIAAATAAGYTLERLTLVNGRNVTRLSKRITGVQGQQGQQVSFDGEGATSGAADTAGLANLNAWRNSRYGSDSAAVSTSQVQDAATSPTTQGVVPTHRNMTKDVN